MIDRSLSLTFFFLGFFFFFFFYTRRRRPSCISKTPRFRGTTSMARKTRSRRSDGSETGEGEGGRGRPAIYETQLCGERMTVPERTQMRARSCKHTHAPLVPSKRSIFTDARYIKNTSLLRPSSSSQTRSESNVFFFNARRETQSL